MSEIVAALVAIASSLLALALSLSVVCLVALVAIDAATIAIVSAVADGVPIVSIAMMSSIWIVGTSIRDVRVIRFLSIEVDRNLYAKFLVIYVLV